VGQQPPVVVFDGDDAQAEGTAGVWVVDLELMILQVAAVALGPLLGVEDESDGADSDEVGREQPMGRPQRLR